MNVIFGLNNRVDQAVLTSSASYLSTLPLANLKDPILPVVARTTSDAAFTITVDLTAKPARNMGCVALANHNLSRAASVTIALYNGATLLDGFPTNALCPWPYLSPDDPHWLAHTYALGIVDTDRISAMSPTLIWFADENLAANKAVITIDDSTNPANYIQIGRLFVGEQLSPILGADYDGISTSINDFSDLTISKRKIKRTRRYTPLRTATIALPNLSKSEAWGGLLASKQANGLLAEVIYSPFRPIWTAVGGVYAIDSNEFAAQFLANITNFDPLKNPYLEAYSSSLTLEEVAR